MNRFSHLPKLAVLSAAALFAVSVSAQVAEKSVVPEAVAVVPAFSQWVNSVVTLPTPVPVADITTVPFNAAPAPAGQAGFEPWPVVVGVPDLPLIGAGAAQGARQWGAAFNYQGMHVTLLVLDAAGRRIETRPVSAKPRPGERFKFRITPTFNALSRVGLVVGGDWTSRRAGQMYPEPGMSVEMNAGVTVDLPLEPNRYFVMGSTGGERLVLTVRHKEDLSDARNQQPAYRMDGRNGSSFLQLVPRGSYPAMEQLVSAKAR